eukprot:5145092-Ditylum_brightwellii.AAC.1
MGKNVTHVYSFCSQCIYLEWRYTHTRKGKTIPGYSGSYDTTKALYHLNNECTSGGQDCLEIKQCMIEQEKKSLCKLDDACENLKKYYVNKGEEAQDLKKRAMKQQASITSML